jgi:16S rRNA (cytosine967-C5)-methyltransferase
MGASRRSPQRLPKRLPKQPPKTARRRRTGAPADARALAVAVLSAALAGESLDSAFAGAERRSVLEPRERAFAHLLVLTTLRRLGQIDDAIARCVEKPQKIPTATRNAMRMGVAQLLFLGTPAHAAVNAAVHAIREPPLKGLVNAVLRRLAREGAALVATQDAARCNTPAWLWQQLVAEVGDAGAHALAAVHQQEPPLDVTPRAEAALWTTRLGGTVLPTGSIRLQPAGPVQTLPGFAEGAWWVQDAAAALPAQLLLAALPQPAGAHIADLCAAPGGKTAQLAVAGARVIAVDRDPARLARVDENLRRLSLPATLVAADATQWRAPAKFDAVLLDAPCTATGTIRRNPDVPWHKDADSVAALQPVQEALLDAAAQMLKPGGVLVYCVCSLDPREGRERAVAFLAAHTDFRRLPIGREEAKIDAVDAEGNLRTYPSHWAEMGGMDGFFAARFKRLA